MRRLGRFQRKAVRYRVSPGGDAAMEANMAGTRRASGWRRAGRRGADGPPWSGRACSGWGLMDLVWCGFSRMMEKVSEWSEQVC